MATAAGAGGADDGTGAYTYKWPRPGLTVDAAIVALLSRPFRAENA